MFVTENAHQQWAHGVSLAVTLSWLNESSCRQWVFSSNGRYSVVTIYIAGIFTDSTRLAVSQHKLSRRSALLPVRPSTELLWLRRRLSSFTCDLWHSSRWGAVRRHARSPHTHHASVIVPILLHFMMTLQIVDICLWPMEQWLINIPV